MAGGEHTPVHLSGRLLRRAVELDVRYADLQLGIVDASVIAVAERENLPIVTFDLEHFRATSPSRGYWKLVLDEQRYRDATGRWSACAWRPFSRLRDKDSNFDYLIQRNLPALGRSRLIRRKPLPKRDSRPRHPLRFRCVRRVWSRSTTRRAR
jgi:hypothetical protein